MKGCNMIFITGDTHSDWMSRFSSDAFPEGKTLSKDDYVIVCGDFGLWHDTKEERYHLKWLEQKPFTTLFVCGNHENYDRLYKYPVEEWHGGKVHKISDSVYHLMRGQVFEIEENLFFTFGGASSHDIRDGILEKDDERISKWYKEFRQFRINHVSWWQEELPSKEEMEEGINNLKRYHNKVDFIITHSPCTSVLKQMDAGAGLFHADRLTDYLQKIKENTEYSKWFFGHMHVNENIPWEKSIAIFEQIIRIA